jgi:hypothetical protein
VNVDMSDHISGTYPPEKYKRYLACYFTKNNPKRYETVQNPKACVDRYGFENIQKLKLVYTSTPFRKGFFARSVPD